MQSLAERRTVFFEFLLFLFSGLLCLAIPSLIIFRQPFLFLTFFYILFSMRRWVRSSLIPVEALGFSRAREGWGVFWFSLVGILLAFFFVAILFPQTIQLEQIRRENALMPVMSVPMIVAYYVFVSVPLQEIVFRVFLLNRLQMCFSFFVKGKLADTLSIIASAVFFGIAHVPFGHFVFSFSTFILGLLWGWMMIRYKNIYPILAIHAILRSVLIRFIL